MGNAEKKPKTRYRLVVWIVIAVLATVLIAGCASQPVKTGVQPGQVTDKGIESLAQRDYSKPAAVVDAYNYTVIQQAAEASFNSKGYQKSLFAESLVNGPENLSEFYILDIRTPEDYAEGHIPGATNIPVNYLFQPDNLAKLPKSRPILVVCASGTSAAFSSSILNLLGYDAWQLRFGMISWRESTVTAVWSMNETTAQIIKGGGYPVTK